MIGPKALFIDRRRPPGKRLGLTSRLIKSTKTGPSFNGTRPSASNWANRPPPWALAWLLRRRRRSGDGVPITLFILNRGLLAALGIFRFRLAPAGQPSWDRYRSRLIKKQLQMTRCRPVLNLNRRPLAIRQAEPKKRTAGPDRILSQAASSRGHRAAVDNVISAADKRASV